MTASPVAGEGPWPFCQGNWLQHNQGGRDYLDVGRDMDWKRAEKQKGARGSPKRYSDAFCCFVFIAKHGHILFPHLPEGNSTPVTDVKLLFKICTPRPPAPLRLPVRGQANPETVATMPF